MKRQNASVQLSGFATGGVFARRSIVRIFSIAARASLSEPPPAAKPPLVVCKRGDSAARQRSGTRKLKVKKNVKTKIFTNFAVLKIKITTV